MANGIAGIANSQGLTMPNLSYLGGSSASGGGKVVNAHWDEWDNKTGRFTK